MYFLERGKAIPIPMPYINLKRMKKVIEGATQERRPEMV